MRVISICFASLVLLVLTIAPPALAQGAHCTQKSDTGELDQALHRILGYRILGGRGFEFDPARELTRREWAYLIVNALGRGDEAAQRRGPAPFLDMEGDIASGYLSILVEEGIVKGYPDGAVRPDEPLPLWQAKVMVARLLWGSGTITHG